MKGIKRNFANKIIDIKYSKMITDRKKRFEIFTRENVKLTKKKYKKEELRELNNLFDNFIVGSDQVWNPNFIDNTYFFDFVDNSKNKISYAPSFAVKSLEKMIKNE